MSRLVPFSYFLSSVRQQDDYETFILLKKTHYAQISLKDFFCTLWAQEAIQRGVPLVEILKVTPKHFYSVVKREFSRRRYAVTKLLVRWDPVFYALCDASPYDEAFDRHQQAFYPCGSASSRHLGLHPGAQVHGGV